MCLNGDSVTGNERFFVVAKFKVGISQKYTHPLLLPATSSTTTTTTTTAAAADDDDMRWLTVKVGHLTGTSSCLFII